jgi:hypothetical protein
MFTKLSSNFLDCWKDWAVACLMRAVALFNFFPTRFGSVSQHTPGEFQTHDAMLAAKLGH